MILEACYFLYLPTFTVFVTFNPLRCGRKSTKMALNEPHPYIIFLPLNVVGTCEYDNIFYADVMLYSKRDYPEWA